MHDTYRRLIWISSKLDLLNQLEFSPDFKKSHFINQRHDMYTDFEV